MGILHARILQWVDMSSSRGSSQLRDWTQVFNIAGGFFTSWATREALSLIYFPHQAMLLITSGLYFRVVSFNLQIFIHFFLCRLNWYSSLILQLNYCFLKKSFQLFTCRAYLHMDRINQNWNQILNCIMNANLFDHWNMSFMKASGRMSIYYLF